MIREAAVTPNLLTPATQPTLYFVGVTTGHSSIQRVFPRWADELGLENARLQGVDLPLHAPAEQYRAVVEFIANDELSLGALVTTHKIDLYDACADMFDEIDGFARLMSETSCISKRNGTLVCHAKDPISSGLALETFVPQGYWQTEADDVLCMGAGGSTIAITWHLTRAEAGDNRPERVIVTNRSPERLKHIETIHDGLDTTTRFEYRLVPTPDGNDEVLASLRSGALVVNATGLGKDAPGSPLTDAAVFPERAIAWDLNYRGDLVFLDQAGSQASDRQVRVEDGWVYFIHGWTQVIAEVFDIELPASGEGFERLSELARSTR